MVILCPTQHANLNSEDNLNLSAHHVLHLVERLLLLQWSEHVLIQVGDPLIWLPCHDLSIQLLVLRKMQLLDNGNSVVKNGERNGYRQSYSGPEVDPHLNDVGQQVAQDA